MASSFLPQLCVSYVIIMQRLHSERKITPIKNLQMCPLHISRKKGKKAGDTKGKKMSNSSRVSVQGVESLWGDCRTQVYSGRLGVIVVDLCYFAILLYFPFLFLNNNICFLLHKNQNPGINMQNGRQVI